MSNNFIYGAGDQQETPNLGLATWGMDEELANNMIILDTAVAAGGTPTKLGTITSVGGQAAVGSLGVPVIVVSYANMNVTTSFGPITLLTNPTPGIYRITPYVSNIGTNDPSGEVSFEFQWTDDSGAAANKSTPNRAATRGPVVWEDFVTAEIASGNLYLEMFIDGAGTATFNVYAVVERLV
jgi:hypothetical protein